MDRFDTDSGAARQVTLRPTELATTRENVASKCHLKCFGGGIVATSVTWRQRRQCLIHAAGQPAVLGFRQNHKSLPAQFDELRLVWLVVIEAVPMTNTLNHDCSVLKAKLKSIVSGSQPKAPRQIG